MNKSWHQESKSLTRAGFGDTDQVMTSESDWPSLGLDWGGVLEAFTRESVKDFTGELDLVEFEDRVGD